MGKTADGSGLCVEHCKIGQQLVDTHPTVDHSAHTPVLLFVVATLVADTSTRSRSSRAASRPRYRPTDIRLKQPPEDLTR